MKTEALERILHWAEGRRGGYVGTEDVLLSMLGQDCVAGELLKRHGLTYHDVLEELAGEECSHCGRRAQIRESG